MIKKKWLSDYDCRILDRDGQEIDPLWQHPASGPALLDLADTLMLHYCSEQPREAFIELKGKGRRIPSIWTEDEVSRIESLFLEDLEWDGFIVNIARLSLLDKPTDEPFIWRLDVSDPDLDDVVEDSVLTEAEPSGPKQTPARYRRLRSDASIPSTLRSIEKVFGLPEGSVLITYRNGRRARSDSNIGAIRKHWDDT